MTKKTNSTAAAETQFNRRSALTMTGAGLTAALIGVAPGAWQASAAPISPMVALEASFNAEWDKYKGMLPAYDAVERRYFEERAKSADQSQEANHAIRSRIGLAKADRDLNRQTRRAAEAADRVLSFHSSTIEEIAAKVRVHKVFDFEASELDFIMDDIARIARKGGAA